MIWKCQKGGIEILRDIKILFNIFKKLLDDLFYVLYLCCNSIATNTICIKIASRSYLKIHKFISVLFTN